MKIRPLHNNVIIQRLEEVRTTASGIVIPDTATEKPAKGKVLAIGSGSRDEAGKLIPLDVKIGDTVYFKEYGYQTIKVDGEEFLVMSEEVILAIDA